MIHLKEYFILSFSLELVISHALTFTFQMLSCSLILITIYLFVYSLMLWCTNLFAYILYFTFHILYLGYDFWVDGFVTESMLHQSFSWMKLIVLDPLEWNLAVAMVTVRCSVLCWSSSISWMDLKHQTRSRYWSTFRRK